MNTLTIPTSVYAFADISDVLSRLSDFTRTLLIDYNILWDDLYGQEIYGLKTVNYQVLTDIFILADLLVRIHKKITDTVDEERLTYSEYMKMFYVDCIFKSLICRHVNVKPLMISFDSGYSNINNVPIVQNVFQIYQ